MLASRFIYWHRNARIMQKTIYVFYCQTRAVFVLCLYSNCRRSLFPFFVRTLFAALGNRNLYIVEADNVSTRRRVQRSTSLFIKFIRTLNGDFRSVCVCSFVLVWCIFWAAAKDAKSKSIGAAHYLSAVIAGARSRGESSSRGARRFCEGGLRKNLDGIYGWIMAGGANQVWHGGRGARGVT